ncbi:MAG: hypothetical protein ACYTGQ_01560, partial [Planctomycetota bacterium]
MSRKRLTSIVLALFACVGSIAMAQEVAVEGTATVDLRPLWIDGQTSRYKITQQEVAVSSSPDNNRTLEERTDIELELTWEVISASPDGGGVATMTLDHLVMTLTGPDGVPHVVTPTEVEEPFATVQDWINALLGTPLQVSIGPTGYVEAVSNFQPIVARAGDAGSDMDEEYFKELALDVAALAGGAEGQSPG